MTFKNLLFPVFTLFFVVIINSAGKSAPPRDSASISASLTGSENFWVFRDTVTQVESTIAVHPSNPLIIAGSTVTDVKPGGYSTGVYISTNGGISWSGSNSIKDSTNKIILTIGNPKITIDKKGTFILSYVAPDPVTGWGPFKIGVSYSTNNGLYWSRTVYVPGVTDGDKSECYTDINPESPFYGRSYITFTSTKAVFFSYSTDNGKSWSTATRICPVKDYSRTGAYLAISPSGELYVTWPYLAESNKYIGFAKSTDGGLTWTSTDKAFQVYPMRDNFRVYLNLCTLIGIPTLAVDNSGGPRNGWIYVVSSEKKKVAGYPALDSGDIVVHISTDRGATWPLKYRVNQDVVPGGRSVYQVFPAITVDEEGGVNVLYYDTRNANPVTRDSSEVFLSRSTNGGANFTDIKISNHKFLMQRLPADKMLFGISSYIGTGIGIAASGNVVSCFWFEYSVNNEYQAWFSNIHLTSPMRNTIAMEAPSEFRLSQNYPNPFNPSTTINFDLPSDAFVTLKVFNVSGKEIANLVNEFKTTGYHSVNFNATGLSSGVYYYRLESNGISKIMKMALIK